MDAAATVLSIYRSAALRLPLPDAPPTENELREYVDDLAQRTAALARQGNALVQTWRQRFPRGSLPFALVLLGGESNTLLRWRCSGIGCRPRGGRIELAGIPDQIAALPPQVRNRILEFERDRIALNYEYALIVYAHARLRDLERHRLALAHLRRIGNGRKLAAVRRD